MEHLEKYRWIDDSVNIDDFYDGLPKIVKNAINECERADKENDWSYTNFCDMVENMAKQFVPDRITKEQWDRLISRYYG